MEGGGRKCLCVVFWLITRSRVRGKKMLFVASYSTSNKLLFVSRHILTTGEGGGGGTSPPERDWRTDN